MRSRARRLMGFTLVEVLVALVVMAVMSALAWRGVDGMLRSRESTQSSLAATTLLATVITQWEQDLSALYDNRSVPPIAFDGNTLRLARNAAGGVQMVAWTVFEGRWQRWASPVVTRAGDLQEHWLRAQQLQGSESEQLHLLDGIDSWQVYFYRDGRLTNAQSSGGLVAAAPAASAASGAASGAAAAPTRQLLPEGVQLVIRVKGQTLKRELALVPQS